MSSAPDSALDSDPDAVIAAVDLGSNSFHMVVARDRHGQLEIIDRLREMVRLASGLTRTGRLDPASQERALDCLRRFGQRLRDMQAYQVRVVGTNTLRKAQRSSEFLEAAEAAIGHPVEVISGIEEARLIYQGVSHSVESSDEQDLVVDIGGGSTELIIGRGYDPLRLESLWLGCVSLSSRCFDDGRLSAKRFAKARLAARLELRPIVTSFTRSGWSRAIGSSGTIRAASRVVRELGASDGTLTAPAVEKAIEAMIAARRIDALALPGLGPDRTPVFPGGVAILVEVLANLDIEAMVVSDGALREGLLYDMLGRRHHHDARERTIRAMQAKFHIDEGQAQRVDATAAHLLSTVAGRWGLDDPRHAQLLSWAARLHEVGLDIAHSKYHLHGGYLLANADLSGFTWTEQQLLALLVANHRRKLDEAGLHSAPEEWRTPIFRLTVLLRLAVLLHRGRSAEPLPPLRLVADEQRLGLWLDDRWFADNPLTDADLSQERDYLSSCDFELVVATEPFTGPTPQAT